MLYLHCGWPRTGTTSLQVALAENRDRLSAAGLLYPDAWNPRGLPAHNGLALELRLAQRSGGELERFGEFLRGHAEGDLLLSAESLTNWAAGGRDEQDMLLRLLDVAQAHMPVRCIWTLRRADEVAQSLYLLRLAVDERAPSPRRHFARLSGPEQLFGGMRRVEEAVGGDTVYVKYDPSGRHNLEILRACGAPDRLVAALTPAFLAAGRNASLSHKQTIVLLNLRAVSARVGVELDGAYLRRAFRCGGLRFERDGPCTLIDAEMRRNIQRRALALAEAHGFAPYVELFPNVEAGSAAVALGPEALDEGDLERLAGNGSSLTATGSAASSGRWSPAS